MSVLKLSPRNLVLPFARTRTNTFVSQQRFALRILLHHLALCSNMNFQIITSSLPTCSLKSFLHAHVVSPFTLPSSYVSFLPPPPPYRQITPSEVRSFSRTRAPRSLPSRFTSPPSTALFPIFVHRELPLFFPPFPPPRAAPRRIIVSAPAAPSHRLLSLQAVPSVVLPLTRVPFAPSLIYCITVHEVANLRRVILYKYVLQINNRAGDMSLCAVPAPRSTGRCHRRRCRRCHAWNLHDEMAR